MGLDGAVLLGYARWFRKFDKSSLGELEPSSVLGWKKQFQNEEANKKQLPKPFKANETLPGNITQDPAVGAGKQNGKGRRVENRV